MQNYKKKKAKEIEVREFAVSRKRQPKSFIQQVSIMNRT